MSSFEVLIISYLCSEKNQAQWKKIIYDIELQGLITSCYWLSCVSPPPTKICWHHNPQDLRMCLYLEIGPFQDIQVKMKSLMWTLIQYECCPIKREKKDIWIQRQTCRGHTTCRVMTGVVHLLYKSRHQKLPANNRMLGRCKKGGKALPTHWFWISSLQNCDIINNFCCFKKPSFW